MTSREVQCDPGIKVQIPTRVPGKSKTVPPPFFSTRLVRTLIKILMVQTNIRGEGIRNGTHALSTNYPSDSYDRYSRDLSLQKFSPLERLPLYVVVSNKLNNLLLSLATVPVLRKANFELKSEF